MYGSNLNSWWYTMVDICAQIYGKDSAVILTKHAYLRLVRRSDVKSVCVCVCHREFQFPSDQHEYASYFRARILMRSRNDAHFRNVCGSG